ncbi:hypothetical protein [Xenorhabdus bovienii]|nr:hypothetical protein [Xenorhabdus bovienii]MDE9455270.1 hypothetical protein [Xenorhabdus bovienii]
MISIDNAQNEISLPGHIDDGCEWAESGKRGYTHWMTFYKKQRHDQ